MTQPNRFLRREDLFAFLGLTGLLIVSQLLAQDGTSAVRWVLQRGGLWSLPWTLLISSLALCAVALSGFLLGRSNPRPGPAAKLGFGVLAFCGLVLSNAVPSWFTEAAHLDRYPIAARFVCFLVLMAILVGLWSRMLPLVQKRFETTIDLDTSDTKQIPEGPVTLIALVSREQTSFSMALGNRTAMVRKPDGTTAFLKFESLADDIRALHDPDWKWPWQQLLRAVERYKFRPGLRIVLVGSASSPDGQRGSHEQLGVLANLLMSYPELKSIGVTVEEFPTPLDFENFNQVKEAVRQCIRDACKRVSETNVFVDITGGQKVASAAAAVATIGTNGKFQYVRTNDPWKILVSDLQPQTMPSV